MIMAFRILSNVLYLTLLECCGSLKTFLIVPMSKDITKKFKMFSVCFLEKSRTIKVELHITKKWYTSYFYFLLAFFFLFSTNFTVLHVLIRFLCTLLGKVYILEVYIKPQK
jgi:hypothetical protein